MSAGYELIESAWRCFSRGDYDSGLKFVFEALELAYKKNDYVLRSQALVTLGNILHLAGRFDEALSAYLSALRIQERLAEKNPFFKTWVATTLNNLGILLSDLRRFEDARDKYERSLTIYEALLDSDPENTTYQSDVATTLNNLGILLSDLRRSEDARDKYERSLTIYEALLDSDPENTTYQSDVAMTLNNLGILLNNLGRFEDARDKYERSLAMREVLLESDPENTTYKSDVATTLNNLGTLLNGLEGFEDAKDRYERSQRMFEMLLNWRRFDNARKRYERSLKMYEVLLKSCPENTTYQSDVAMTLNNLGNLLNGLGRVEDAKDRYERSLKMYEVLLDSDPENITFQSRAASTTLRYWETVIEILDSTEIQDSLAEYRNASHRLAEKAEYFKKLGLIYESTLIKKLGIVSELKYNAKTIRLERAPEKRISGYNKCAEIASSLSKIESDREQIDKWSDMTQYYIGRALANESMINGLNQEKLKKAVETFKHAKNSCNKADTCYCIYDTLLPLTEMSNNKIDLPKFKRRLRKTIEKIGAKTASGRCLLKIEDILEQNEENADIDKIMTEFNNEMIRIEHHALRGLFKHVSDELSEYFKNPMEINVNFQNWSLTGEISKIEGTITIKTGDTVLWKGNVERNKKFSIQFEPQNPTENICFEHIEKPHIKRTIKLKCCEIIGDQMVYFLKRRIM
ncbi:MAG: hypothetical protein AEth_00022 [Candidatus Argoarchaeum ethanivorans]|uniref:MalT-like TPR region domain-containing protein n=1 Tax=Candidatus Argoarchaeum ethanivorans TaxID=2608793 RepID=A0A8B3S7T3_9EURY|nr:MAG: hypothetical protein AEth_00022 [Candidatus Argoarchaeum ethanivorans]